MSNQVSSASARSFDTYAVRKRVAVICDYLEEQWPSMDFAAEMLVEELGRRHSAEYEAIAIRPPFIRRFSRLPFGPKRFALNADRALNRFLHYPRRLRELSGQFELFHVVDHSYAHLVNELPAQRTVVTCHDLDAFRCLLEPKMEPRSTFFKAMTGRVLAGLRRAARVICDSHATRAALLRYGLVEEDRIAVIPIGVHAACSPVPERLADAEAACLLGRPDKDATIIILHVGSTIPRKRIDLLLRIFAAISDRVRGARLVHAGGALTREQSELAALLGIERRVQILPFVSRSVLAAIYRRATLVLLPSENEGFGLPLIEAMACGTPVIASDLPVLREAGGESPVYLPVGHVDAWTDAAVALIKARHSGDEGCRLRQRAGFDWVSNLTCSAYAERVAAVYQQILG